MAKIAVAAAVINQTPLDWNGNYRRILGAINAAREQRAAILCLPELCITGYGCEDAFLSPSVQSSALEILQEILPATQGLVVTLGLPLYHCGAVFNAACLVVNGQLLGFVGKKHLAGEGIHYEPRWFKPWPIDTQVSVQWRGKEYPLGDYMFNIGGLRMGFEICEDAWVAERPGAVQSRRGCELLFNPSASHFAFGKHEIRKRFVLEGSRAFNVGYIYANLLGNEAGRAIYDGDAMIASGGELLAAGPRFSYADYQVTSAIIDFDTIRMLRGKSGSFRPAIDERPDYWIHSDFAIPTANSVGASPAPCAWETSRTIKEEEFTRAVALGLCDYLRKSRSQGFVVSLSGGADSATLCVLIAKMVEFGLQELGADKFLQKLGLRHAPLETVAPKLVAALLTTAYQATKNSSTTTREAARAVANAVGAKFLEFEIENIVQAYKDIVAGGIGRELSWERDDLALQNIQARVRSPSVWMLANLTNSLLLSTSNRSEAAVGYATMDGDTSGGLAPIAGIDKAFIRHWLRWMETQGPVGASSIPALKAVNVQAPTAELRPTSSKQTDEDDLMPYEVLDSIERAAIRDKKAPLECLQRLETQFAQYEQRQLALWTERFFQLWCRNQWKRERYAPSFHLDDENLDPKTWCRFPILSGGYERELAAMWRYVEQPPQANTETHIMCSTKYLNLVQRGHWYYATRPNVTGVVCIAGLTSQREIVLVEQYRLPVNANVIEFPAGLVGDHVGSENESLLDAARRELFEETGYEAEDMQVMFAGPASAGLSDELITFILASGLRKTGDGMGDGTENITQHVVPLDQAWEFLLQKQQAGSLIESRLPTCLYLLEHFCK